jgi:hypothetical protein
MLRTKSYHISVCEARAYEFSVQCYVGQCPMLCWTLSNVMLDVVECYVGHYPMLCWTLSSVMLDIVQCCTMFDIHILWGGGVLSPV